MAISSFSTLKTALADWLARSDLSQFYDDIILLGEERLCRDLHIRAVESTFSDGMVSGEVALPTGFLGLKHARIESINTYLQMREADWIYESYPTRASDAEPIYIAVDNTKFIFGPYPDAVYTVDGTYFQKPTVLSTGSPTNEWTTNTPDALLMACLAESAPFLKDDGRVAIWEDKYGQIRDGYLTQNSTQARRTQPVTYR